MPIVPGHTSVNIVNLTTDANGALLVTGSVGGGGSGGSVTVTNFPAVQTVTGSVTVTDNPLTPVFGSVDVTVSGASGLMVAAPQGAPLWVTGSFASSGGSPASPTYISVTSSLPVTVNNFPATQTVTGSVGIANVYQGLPALSTGIAQAPQANQLDVFPWTISLTGSMSASNGQTMPLHSDFQGNLASREQYIPVAEDNLVGVYATAPLPNISSKYTPTTTGSVGLLPGVLKASPGTLYRVFANNANAVVRYLQLFNNTTGPSGTPVASFQIPSSGVSGSLSNPVFDASPWGAFFSVGISIGVSTSHTTYSAATAGDTDTFAMFI